ncbi:MAG TPA: glycosyltransferase family 87 protein [Terriglobales bacterium]|nr:glycosyltransferase family 87 protein [Terriglobales bacterium]
MKKKDFKTPLLLWLAAMAALDLLLAWNSRDLLRQGYQDFTIFYSAAKIVRQGLGHQLYDERTQYRIQQGFTPAANIRKGPLPYNHPPFEVLIFVPFSLLPYLVAYLLWDLASLLILLLLFVLLRPHISILRQVSVVHWLLASLGYFPTFFALLQGQDTLLLLLIFTLVFIFLKTESEFAAGCCLGLGLFRPQLVLPLVLVLLLERRRKAFIGFIVVATILGLISVAMVGVEASLHYPGSVWRMEQVMERPGTVVPVGMPNLRGLLQGPFTHFVSRSFSDVLLALVSVALVLFAAFRWNTTAAATFNCGFSLCVIATILVSYHTFAYDLSLLMLPIALVTDHLEADRGIHGWTRVALLGPVLLLFLTPLHMFLAFYEQRYSLMAVLLVVWLGAVAREISSQRATSVERQGLGPA